MNQEEKQLLINRQVEKSHHFIRQSEEMMTLGHSDLAVNRYYYACFHIVQALFLQKGISVRTHSGMISQPAFRENGHRLFGRRQFACPIIPTPAESRLQLRVRCYGR